MDEAEVKILVRCGLRMLKPVFKVAYFVDDPEDFFAEDVDVLVC